jgi:hypothetical protein
MVAQTVVNFGSLDLYVAGGGLPDGDYVISSFDVMMYQAKRQDGSSAGPARLGVMITCLPLSDPTEENKKTQFYSMGSKADQSFAPNPETGKGVVPIPGAKASTFNHSTNWALFLKSLHDSGLPDGIFTNDISVLDGIHVHMQNVPEPEERKGFQAATGEASDENQQRKGTVAIVTEIKEDGKPWEGTGGVPETKPVAKKGAPTPAAKTAPKVAHKVTPKAAPAPVEESGDEDVKTAAINGISTVLERNPNGLPRIALRTETFKAVKESAGEDMAGSVISSFFEGPGSVLANLLGELGYAVVGVQVKPA